MFVVIVSLIFIALIIWFVVVAARKKNKGEKLGERENI